MASGVPVARPRVRQCGGKELPLGTYQLFQRVSPAEETVWSNIMRGLSMRHYKEVLQQFMDAYGLEPARSLSRARTRLQSAAPVSAGRKPCFAGGH